MEIIFNEICFSVYLKLLVSVNYLQILMFRPIWTHQSSIGKVKEEPKII